MTNTIAQNQMLPRSSIPDIVNDKYKIHLHKEVTDLSNNFCHYYLASDSYEQEDFFAIVFDHRFLHPIDTIKSLVQNDISYLNKIHEYSIVRLSSTDEEHLVVIVDGYHPKHTLAEYVLGTSLDTDTLDDMLGKLIQLMDQLSTLGIYCYNINPHNILWRDGTFFALKEFICAYPHFEQLDTYLAPEVAECHKAARYVASNKGDIYALGITACSTYFIKDSWPYYHSIQEYNYGRFENSTYKYLLAKKRVPERWRLFLQGTMNNNASARWGIQDLVNWFDGYNSKSVPEIFSENKNIIAFNECNYSNPKSLAYALYNNWNQGIEFIQDSKLLKWLDRDNNNNNNNNILEPVKNLLGKNQNTHNMLGNASNTKTGSSTQLMQILSLLDNNGSIRYANISFTAASIRYFLHYLIMHNQADDIEQVVYLIKNEHWSDNCDSAYYLDSASIAEYKYAASHIESKPVYKGVRRFVYVINPTACCMSGLLKNRYVTNIRELLIAVNQLAIRKQKLFIDRHIIAFAEARLGIKDITKPIILSSIQKFAENIAVQWLSIISVLSHQEPTIDLLGINRVIINNLKEMCAEHIHNVQLKTQVQAKLDAAAQACKIEDIIQIFSDQQQFINDYNQYHAIRKEIDLIDHEIKSLNKRVHLTQQSLLFGQKATVLLSYVLCLVVTVVAII